MAVNLRHHATAERVDPEEVSPDVLLVMFVIVAVEVHAESPHGGGEQGPVGHDEMLRRVLGGRLFRNA